MLSGILKINDENFYIKDMEPDYIYIGNIKKLLW